MPLGECDGMGGLQIKGANLNVESIWCHSGSYRFITVTFLVGYLLICMYYASSIWFDITWLLITDMPMMKLTAGWILYKTIMIILPTCNGNITTIDKSKDKNCITLKVLVYIGGHQKSFSAHRVANTCNNGTVLSIRVLYTHPSLQSHILGRIGILTGMPVCLCGKPGDIFHDGNTRTAQHHRLKAAFRHPTYSQRLFKQYYKTYCIANVQGW